MEPASEAPILSWILRLLGALFLGSLGGLLLWVTGVVLVSPMPGEHPLAVLALKVFTLGIMGTLGFVCSSGALLMIIPGGRRWLESPPIPQAVQELCPGCGARRASENPCSDCGLPPVAAPTSPYWRRGEHQSIFTSLFVTSIFIGIFALGVFLLVVQFSTQHNSWWSIVVGLVVAGILLCVGLAGALTGILELKSWKNWKRTNVFEASSTVPLYPHRCYTVQARAEVHRQKVVAAKGFSSLVEERPSKPIPLTTFSAECLLVYRFLAVATLQQLLRVACVRQIEWSLSSEADLPAQASYRTASEQGELHRDVISKRRIYLRGWLHLQEEEHPISGIFSAIQSIETVESLLDLVRRDATFQEHLQEELFVLSQDLSEVEIEQEAGVIAALVESSSS